VSQLYNCVQCDLTFDSKKKFEAHVIFSHKTDSTSKKKILILGGGFGGMHVLKELQKKLDAKNTSITIVSDNNYFLFTPMLPEVASGMLNPRDITTPIREFCTSAKFYQATVFSVDLQQRLVTITRKFDGKNHALEYDYLVLAVGSDNNFYGNKPIEENSFPIKTVEDAIELRNQTLSMMEIAAQTGSVELQQKFLTFTVVGAGFAGVEIIGEINHFVRKSVKQAYPTINENNINMILISSKNEILPELNYKLGESARSYLKKMGVRIISNVKAIDAGESHVELSDGEIIPCTTLIWTGGVTTNSMIKSLICEHDKGGKVLVDKFLRLKDHPEVFALGDCAAILDTDTGKFYPPTAQHALRESTVVAQNIKKSLESDSNLKEFSYQSKGMMATIGNKAGVASLMGLSITGVLAWVIWRTYYLSHLPTFESKVKIGIGWAINSFFGTDLTLIGETKTKYLHKITIDDDTPSLKDQLVGDL
jgi:NADH dehydrogenase